MTGNMEIRQERRKWTEAEDAILKQEVKSQRETGLSMNWAAISEKLPGRTNKDCRKRWSKSVDGGRKGIWTQDEDKRLIHAVSTHGTRWTQVAQYVGTRHADQCAKRWQHSLDPNVNRSDWSQQEDDALFLAVSDVGRNWRHIASTTLPGRSTTHLKNRYELICRRRQERQQNNLRNVSIDDDELESADRPSRNGAGQHSDVDQTTQFGPQHDTNLYVQSNPLDIESFPGFHGIHLGQPPYDGDRATRNVSIPDSLDTAISSENSFPSIFDESLTSQYATPDSFWSNQGNDQMILDPQSYSGNGFSDMAICDSGITMPSTPASSIDYAENGMGKFYGLDMTSTNCTLVLEGIEADTVGLICDSLAKKNIRFDMRIHRNNG